MADCNTIPYTIAGIIVGALGGSLSTFFIGRKFNKNKDEKDSQTIYNWLSRNANGTNFTYRSTNTIASETNLPHERVRYICSIHPPIRSPRGHNAKDQWGLRTVLDNEEGIISD